MDYIREIPFNENDIIIRLGKIAGIVEGCEPAAPYSAQVTALNILTDIYMLRARNLQDIDRFYGWTYNERKAYADNGAIPRRFAELFNGGPAPRASGAKGKSKLPIIDINAGRG